MLTLLSVSWGGEVHSKLEPVESIIKKLRRSDKLMEKLLPSKKRPFFDNRVSWTQDDSLKAGRT
jgi:hypothetical protein